MSLYRTAAVAFILGAGTLSADPPFDLMKQQTVIVGVELQLNNGRGFGHGSGFVIGDGRYVVTNHHVCCEKDPREVSRKLSIRLPDREIPARVVWSSDDKDLGIVATDQPFGRPAARLTPGNFVHDGQAIWVLGFPGVSDMFTDQASHAEVKISSGIISARVKAANDELPVADGTPLYQSTAPTNRGNSGGPVFDSCGRVIAVHSAGAYVKDVQGVKFEIPGDLLLEELAALKIAPNLDESECVSGGVDTSMNRMLLIGQVGSIALGVVAIGLAVTRRGRETVKKALTSRRRPEPDPGPGPRPGPTPPPLPRIGSKPMLKGIAGYYSGSELELGADAFTIGRDGRAASLVVPSEAGSVSRRHCSVRYDSAGNRFFIEDCWSTNGTFLDSGEQLPPGEERELKPGDRFYIGDRENVFEVALEKDSR